MLVFGGIGVILVGLAATSALELHRKLQNWPRVQARVDSADVTSPIDPRRDVYASRQWLTYTYDGWRYVSPVVEGVYQSGYGSAVSRGATAVRRGDAQIMLDPRHPRELELDPGYTWRFFFGPLLFAGLGAVFGAFGIMSLVMGLRHGMDQPAFFFVSMSTQAAVWFAGGMGALFLGGTVIALWIAHGQRTSWMSVDAHVDSADVVQASHSTWAVRQWLGYSVRGQSYRAPLTSSFSTSSYRRQADKAKSAKSERPLRVFADASNPYFLVSSSQRTGSMIILPLIFGGIGVLILVVAVLLHRGNTRASKTRRPQSR